MTVRSRSEHTFLEVFAPTIGRHFRESVLVLSRIKTFCLKVLVILSPSAKVYKEFL